MLQVSACNKVVSLKEQTDVESLVLLKTKVFAWRGCGAVVRDTVGKLENKWQGEPRTIKIDRW